MDRLNKKDKYCPNCMYPVEYVFYKVMTPVMCSFLFPDAESALKAPVGQIDLMYCKNCDFVFNSAFENSLLIYDETYEETQGYSPRFNVFIESLASDLVEKFNLIDKVVLEIGCGKGQFLELLVKLGIRRGVGFDPVFMPERIDPDVRDKLEIYKEYYTADHSYINADFICCRHTLEHIDRTFDFLSLIRGNIGDAATPVFIEVPNLDNIIENSVFWDIYYEHCSYFSQASLERVLAYAGFKLVDIWTDYDDQYLLALAVPIKEKAITETLSVDEKASNYQKKIRTFEQDIKRKIGYWERKMDGFELQQKRAAIWGAGSKAVSFLSNLVSVSCIKGIVDINPHKHGKYLPNFGRPILGPKDLIDHNPDVVVVMNAIYKEEITGMLKEMNLSPEVLALE